jgi:hypothetical protein
VAQARPPLSIDLIRTAEGWYVQRDDRAFPVDAELPTTAALLADGLEAVRAAASATAGAVPAGGLPLRLWVNGELGRTGPPPTWSPGRRRRCPCWPGSSDSTLATCY